MSKRERESDANISRKRRRLRTKKDAAYEQEMEREKEAAVEESENDEFSSGDEDSFIVYSEDEEDDPLDLVSEKLRSAFGVIDDDDFMKELVDVLGDRSDDMQADEVYEPRRLREELGEDVSDDEPQIAEVKRSGKFIKWRNNIKKRDSNRRRGAPLPTPLEQLVCPKLGMLTPLFFHQALGLAWCMLREEIPHHQTRGGILADDMGAGKTLQMLSLIAMDKICGYAHDSNREVPHKPPTLVVCPAVLADSWMSETQRHFGWEFMTPLLLRSSTAKNWSETISSETILDADVVVVSYTNLRNVYMMLRRELRGAMHADLKRFRKYLAGPEEYDKLNDLEFLNRRINQRTQTLSIGYRELWGEPESWKAKHFIFGYPWRRAVFDECTSFKNDSTLNFESVQAIDAERKWSLSGTPMENKPDELYSQLSVLGVTEHAPMIGTKKRWAQLIAQNEFGCEIKTNDGRPTSHAVRVLKREFLNVLVLRREIQTISLIDPLSSYCERATCAENTSRAWDEFIETLDWQDDEGDEESGTPPQLSELPGFYWKTHQEKFQSAFRRVERWLHEGTGLELTILAKEIRSARARVVDSNGVALETEGTDTVASLFGEVQSAWPNGEQLAVWSGFATPKSVLLLGRMHALERAVYTHLTSTSKEEMSRHEDDGTAQQNLAFVAVVNCRCATADYRYPMGVASFLDGERGSDLWSRQDPSFTMNGETRQQQDLAEEVDNLRDVVGEETNQVLASQDTGNFEVPLSAPTKFRMVDRYVSSIPEDDKVLVFSDMVRFFPQLRRYLESRGHTCAVLCGSMSAKARDSEIARFRKKGKGGARIFILSLMLAKQGMNFQEANHVILYTVWWNPAVESQAERRVARPGQKKQVYFVRLALLDTIDEIVITRAGVKTEMITEMIGRDDGLVATGANFSRPETNCGILLDTDGELSTPPENETLADILRLPMVDFSPDEALLEKLKKIHATDGRINKRNLASVVLDRYKKKADLRFVTTASTTTATVQ